MSFRVWTELVCRGCNNTVAGIFVRDRIPRRQMKNTAAMHGWKYDPEADDWFCRSCKSRPRDEE